jgi:hypothetical protein
VQVTGTLPLTRSVAAGIAYFTLADPTPLTSTVTVFAGANFGAVVSRTVTLKEAAAPPAVQVTVVTPSGNVAPGPGVQVAGWVPFTGSDAVCGV